MKAYEIAYNVRTQDEINATGDNQRKYKDGVVVVHATKAEAEANLSKEHSNHVVISTPIDGNAFSLAELGEIYNVISKKGYVTRFRDLETGRKRLLEAVRLAAGEVPEDTNGGEATNEASKENSDVPTTKKTKKAKSHAKTKKPAGAKKPRASGDAEKKINIIVKENPRRAGSAGFKSYALMTQGMKVSTYLEKGGRMQDLRWDVAAGNVKLVD